MIVAYAITRHHLMDIEVIIRKTLVFTGMFVFIFGVFVGISLLVSQLIGGGRVIPLFISAVLITIGLRPIEAWLVKVTDRFLFQKEYDPQELLKEISQGMVGKVEFTALKEFISDILLKKLRVENIFVLEAEEDKAILLKDWHKTNKRPLLYDETSLTPLKSKLKELKTALSIPIFLKEDVFWLLLLGHKKSGRAYSAEDVNILETLSHEITIALENARNFQELKRSQLELLRQENLKFVQVLVKGLAHEILNPLTPLMHRIEDLEGEDFLKLYDLYEENKAKLSPKDSEKFKQALISLRNSTQSLKNNAQHIHNPVPMRVWNKVPVNQIPPRRLTW